MIIPSVKTEKKTQRPSTRAELENEVLNCCTAGLLADVSSTLLMLRKTTEMVKREGTMMKRQMGVILAKKDVM